MALGLAGLLLAGSALADGPSPPSEAEVIFAEARKLEESGDVKSACSLYRNALELEPNAIGGRLHLARCLERIDLLASAAAEYERAEAAATAANQSDRAQHAKKQLQLLVPRLGTVVVEIPRAVRETAEGLEVTIDGAPIAAGRWGQPVPVDAGKRALRATASGRASFSTTFEARNGVLHVVEVPVLLRRQTTFWPWIVGGLGVAMGGAAAAFAVDQAATQREVNDHCDATSCDRRDGFDPESANARLDRDFGLALGLGIGGGLALSAGIVGLVVGGGDNPSPTAKVLPMVGPRTAGLVVEAVW